VRTKWLDNKLRMYRKKAGYTLPHASFLIGSKDPRYFERLELGQREPTGQDIYSCERIFGVSNRDIFPSLQPQSYKKADRRMMALSSRLRVKFTKSKTASRRIARALAFLTERLRPIVSPLSV
jgi:transcriptional regulator with XRE-family HTH domain